SIDTDPRLIGRREFLGRAAAVGLGASAGSVLLPTGAGHAAEDTTQKRDLVIVQASGAVALDPHASTYAGDVRVKFNLFDTLVRRHPDGTLHPGLATTWQRVGPTTLRLTLRKACYGTMAPDSQRLTPSTASIERSTRPSRPRVFCRCSRRLTGRRPPTQ